jgi:hypothetical protein
MTKPTNTAATISTRSTPAPREQTPEERQTARDVALFYKPLAPPAREFYPIENALRPVFVNREAEVLTGLGKTKAQYADYATSRVQLMRETGLPAATMKKLIDYEINDDLAVARGREPMSQPEFFEMQQRAHEELRSLYGDSTDDLVERANKFVKAHPTLNELLDKGMMSSRPDVVLALAQFVRDANYR